MPNKVKDLLEAERNKAERRYKRLMDSVMRWVRNQLRGARSYQDIQRILKDLINSKLSGDSKLLKSKWQMDN